MSNFSNFSVQGQLFSLETEAVVRKEWLLKTMLETNLPNTKIGENTFYVDCDAASFRVINSVLNNIMQIEELEKTLSLIELNLLNATARYLLCLDLAEKFQAFIDNRSTELQIKERTNRKLSSEKDILRIELKSQENEMNERINSLTADKLRLKNGVKKFQDVLNKSKNICPKCESVVYVLTESSKPKKMHSSIYVVPTIAIHTPGAVGDVICNCGNSNKSSWITPTVTSQDVSSVADFLHLN
jgi:hypothetical protein